VALHKDLLGRGEESEILAGKGEEGLGGLHCKVHKERAVGPVSLWQIRDIWWLKEEIKNPPIKFLITLLL